MFPFDLFILTVFTLTNVPSLLYFSSKTSFFTLTDSQQAPDNCLFIKGLLQSNIKTYTFWLKNSDLPTNCLRAGSYKCAFHTSLSWILDWDQFPQIVPVCARLQGLSNFPEQRVKWTLKNLFQLTVHPEPNFSLTNIPLYLHNLPPSLSLPLSFLTLTPLITNYLYFNTVLSSM